MANSKAVFPARFYALLFVTGIASFLVHELAHWATGIALGHEMVATLNSVSPKGAVSLNDQVLIVAAGPILTLAQGLGGFWLVKQRSAPLGFALLYIAFFMRLLAAGIGAFNPNDEAKVGQLLGLGTWTLPVAVVGILLTLVVLASRKLELRVLDQLLCYAVSSAVITLIVGADMALWPKA
ncbi:hypothetical protein ACW5F0_11825 [Luteimonas sp. A534]